jgi:NAD(P)H-dependent flavin oxidoreductase YrpB (nitropropane dioxygenase family)
MSGLLDDLGLSVPLVAAPMAGGPSTPPLVIAAAHSGGIGFLAGGYKSCQDLADQIAAIRAAGVSFGVNLFAPNPVPVDAGAFRDYAELIRPEASRFGLDTRDVRPREDDDGWSDKLDLLLADPVPIVSFTFGIPPSEVIAALRAAGTVVVQTVTSAEEARLAVAAGADALAVQASAAGGHSGTLTPGRIPPVTPLTELLAAVRAQVSVTLFGAGGLATSSGIAAALHAGASAVAVGTVLLRADESGTSAAYRRGLADPNRAGTVVTRAFTGRPARALRNDFVDRFDAAAPSGYPALHHLTRPLRAAATAAGDPERINLWAGTGYREARDELLADTFARLAAQL